MAARDAVNNPGPMSGHVEIDETYIGGREKNKHASKRVKGTQGTGSAKTKSIVFGMLQRDGNVKCKVVPNTNRATLEPIIAANVLSGTTISTDELVSYKKKLPCLGYTHGTVKHGIEQYVNGIHHTNGQEGFWSHLKRGIVSTHVSVSPKHLQKYVDEFGFRYNNRQARAEMFQRMLVQISKKTTSS
jgi:transposase-like protein